MVKSITYKKCNNDFGRLRHLKLSFVVTVTGAGQMSSDDVVWVGKRIRRENLVERRQVHAHLSVIVDSRWTTIAGTDRTRCSNTGGVFAKHQQAACGRVTASNRRWGSRTSIYGVICRRPGPPRSGAGTVGRQRQFPASGSGI